MVGEILRNPSLIPLCAVGTDGRSIPVMDYQLHDPSDQAGVYSLAKEALIRAGGPLEGRFLLAVADALAGLKVRSRGGIARSGSIGTESCQIMFSQRVVVCSPLAQTWSPIAEISTSTLHWEHLMVGRNEVDVLDMVAIIAPSLVLESSKREECLWEEVKHAKCRRSRCSSCWRGLHHQGSCELAVKHEAVRRAYKHPIDGEVTLR